MSQREDVAQGHEFAVKQGSQIIPIWSVFAIKQIHASADIAPVQQPFAEKFTRLGPQQFQFSHRLPVKKGHIAARENVVVKV